MSNENTGVEGGKCTGEKWIKLLDEGNLWLFSRNGKLHHILQNSYSRKYIDDDHISFFLWTWNLLEYSEDTAAKKLTIFSVLIELSEATKSWHDTFVGTPGKNKLIENWIELISLHPPTCQIFNQENPWKSFFRSNFPCRFFYLLEPILQAYLSIRLSDSLFFRYIVDHPWQDSPINSSLQ